MEMTTGLIDGWYRDKSDAEGVAREYYREKHPWGAWVVVALIDSDGRSRIPDSRFPARVLRGIPHGITDINLVIQIVNENRKGGQ